MGVIRSIGSIIFATPIGWAAMVVAAIVMSKLAAG